MSTTDMRSVVSVGAQEGTVPDGDGTGVTAKGWCGARGKGEDMVPPAGGSQPVGHKVAQVRDLNPEMVGALGEEGRPQAKWIRKLNHPWWLSSAMDF